MCVVGEGTMQLKPGGWQLFCWLVDIQVLNQGNASHQHSYFTVNIYVLPILINFGVGAASPPVVPLSVRPLRHRKVVTDCCLWQAVWGENDHLFNSQRYDWIQTEQIFYLISTSWYRLSVSTTCNFHTVFLRNPKIEQEGKEWVKTEQESCQLPFCGPSTVRVESW